MTGMLAPATKARVSRLRHRDVRDHTGPEKAFIPGEGAIDKLVYDDECAGCKIFPE